MKCVISLSRNITCWVWRGATAPAETITGLYSRRLSRLLENFNGQAFDEWANLHGVKLVFNRPGKPVDNASIESFNRRLRDECLAVNWFGPHCSLSGQTPLEFLALKKICLFAWGFYGFSTS